MRIVKIHLYYRSGRELHESKEVCAFDIDAAHYDVYFGDFTDVVIELIDDGKVIDKYSRMEYNRSHPVVFYLRR